MARGRYNKRGRGGGGRGRGGRGGGGGGGSRNFPDNRQSFDQLKKENEKLERFYNTLGVIPAGPERDNFWATLRRELPNSFRFTGFKGHALAVRDNLVTRFFPLIRKITHEGNPVELPTPIPWYPEGLAYSMTTPKNVVRKYEPFKEFQRFLVSETGVGNISRQEHVSMIPPLLMDIQPHHAVLDLCAAPGSKSAQLVEAIHAGEEERVVAAINGSKEGGGSLNGTSGEDGGRATGLLIANDVNYQRAQMLVHQVKRLNSPNLIVTNHDATMFPSIELPSAAPEPGQPKRGKYLKFDRILADVPCSGDGTARKNPSIWKDWTPQNGLGLYITQVRILTRSLQMLKVGGRVVYSTCSMNPVENEAVVSSAIERCGGVAKVKLIDCTRELPRLIRNNGLTDWSIMNKTGRIYESYAEAAQYDEPEDSKIVPGMFAPEEAEQIPLQRCMRVYPHQQDTGGFFIAVLEKLSEIRAKPESEAKCMKKDWIYTAPGTATPAQTESAVPTQPEPTTTFQQLLDEVDHPIVDVETTDDLSSSSARQNGEATLDADTASATKRKADDATNEGVAKRAKVGDGPSDVDIQAESSKLLPSADTSTQPTTLGDIPTAQPRRRRNGDDVPNEEAFKYIVTEHPELQTIFNFYDLHSSFPRDRFLVRNHAGDPVKGIYYSSQLVKDILTTNEGRGMKFVHAGVKMFMKQDAQGQDICRWRIQTEGLPIIEGWVGDRRTIRLWKKSTLRKLLVEMFPKIGSEDSAEGEGWRALGEIGEQVLHVGMGCCVLRVQPSEDEDGFPEPLVLPLWRSLHSLNLMLPKEDRRAMLLRIYNEDVELINHSDSYASRKGDTKAVKGSVSAEGEAKEVERRMAEVNGDSELLASAETVTPLKTEVTENGVDLAAVALDQDMTEEHERLYKEEAVKREDEDTKIKDAMPERAGETDEANTTV